MKYKTIPGYEDLYTINEFGEVYSMRNGIFLVKDRTDGYSRVCLNKNGVGKNFLVHRLVATLFVSKPEADMTVNHIDGNRENNHYSNLEWCTKGENTKKAWLTGLITKRQCARGEENGNTKLTKEKVLKIREEWKNGAKGDFLGKKYGVSRVTIHLIVFRKTWKHI